MSVDARRDQWGRYLVVPPGDDQPRGYTRVTTVAKVLDDGGGLLPWKATATMVGALRRPGLHAQWEALVAKHPDPWYASPQSKKKCKKLVEECAEAGGSTDRAELGDALHAIAEQFDLAIGQNEPLPVLGQDGTRADLEAYRAAIDAAGIRYDWQYIERTVVLDEWRVAGTPDRGWTYVPDHGPVVADLKTGASLDYSWQAIAVQLAAYANADACYYQGPADDGSEDQRWPMPKLNREVGLVIHLPAGEARCVLHLVDLTAGWEAFKQSMWARQWRKRKDLARFYVIAAPASHPAVTPPAGEGTAGTSPAELDPVPHVDEHETRRGLLLARFMDLCDDDQARFRALNVDRNDLDAVEQALDEVDPFAFDEVRAEAEANDIWDYTPVDERPPPQLPTPTDEGADVDDATFAVLKRTFKDLPTEARTWVHNVILESRQANVSFLANVNGGRRTVRRFELYRGLITLAAADLADDELVRQLVATVLDSDAPFFPIFTVGQVVGSLGVDHAEAFALACDIAALAPDQLDVRSHPAVA